MSRDLTLSVIIVTHQSRDVVGECLDALRSDRILSSDPDADCEVIVVDSGSTDGTPESVGERYPACRVVPSFENVGFARGCNLGLEDARGRYVLLLNPDAVPAPGAVRRLIDYLEANPGTAAVGPQLYYEDGAEQISTQGFPCFTSELSRQWERIARLFGVFDPRDGAPDDAGPVDWVSGASLMIRRSVLDEVGPLDGGYFLYYEETDWCLRATQAGYEIHFDPGTRVVHIGGKSAEAAGVTVRKGRVASHFEQSRRRYFKKHHGALVAFAVEVLHGLRSLRESVLPRSRDAA